MKANNTSNNQSDDPLDKELDLSKMRRLGRASELGKVAPAAAVEPRNIKVHISIKLDADVLEWFKALAADPDSAGYQTLINNALRERMERETVKNDLRESWRGLVLDEDFVKTLTDRVAECLASRTVGEQKRAPAE